MSERLRGNEYRTTKLCVDSYDGAVPVGRFYNPGCDQELRFRSLSELLTQMQDMLDGMQLPQAFTVTRGFSIPGPEYQENKAPPSNGERPGGLATFAVRILFRQNASWQGSVAWLEGGQEESFRSALELIFLLDSVLKRERETARDAPPHDS